MSASLADVKASILEQFGSQTVDDGLVAKCKTICDKYDRNVKDFQLHLEAFIINGNHDALSMENIGELEVQVHKETQKERVNPHHAADGSPSTADYGISGKRPFHIGTPIGDERTASVFIKCNTFQNF